MLICVRRSPKRILLPVTKGMWRKTEKSSSVDDFIMRTNFFLLARKKAIWHRRALEIILIFANCSIIMDVLEWRNLHLKWNSNSFYLTALISPSCRLEYNPIKGWSVQLRPLVASPYLLSIVMEQLFLAATFDAKKFLISNKVSDFFWVSRFRGLLWACKRQQRISEGRQPTKPK